MKHSLGNLIVFILLLLTPLCAEDFAYAMKTNKHNVYLKEPLLLSIDINQTNPDVVLLFHFKVNKSDAYRIEQIDSIQDRTSHRSKIHYTYQLYPLKTGDITITVDLVKRVTTDASVAYFFSGDRDDFKKLETKDIPVTIPPLHIKVKPLPSHTQLVGEFTLSHHFKSTTAQAHEPIPFTIRIKGEGFPPRLETLLPPTSQVKDANLTYFTREPIIKKTILPQGIHYDATYTMALSANHNFTLPKIDLMAFNPISKRPYTLTIPAQTFTITAPPQGSLIDPKDTPSAIKSDFQWLQTLLGYLLVFGAGFFTAKASLWPRKKSSKVYDPLLEKIAQAKDSRTLFQLLLATNDPKFHPIIQTLEESLYSEGKIELKKIKHSAQELV